MTARAAATLVVPLVAALLAAGGAPAAAQPAARADTAVVRSPDGALVAFVRDTPGDSIETGLGVAPRTELWVARPNGTGARRLLRGRDDGDLRRVLAGLSHLAFSPGGRTLYVASAAWATSGALHAVDVATGREWFVCPSNGYEVLRRGPLAGHLLTWQHRYYPVGEGSYEAAVLVPPSGSPERFVTDEDAPDAEARLAAVRAGRVPPARPFPRRYRPR